MDGFESFFYSRCFVALICYFVIGFLYLRFMIKAQGVNQIPNRLFWIAFGNKIAVRFFISSRLFSFYWNFFFCSGFGECFVSMQSILWRRRRWSRCWPRFLWQWLFTHRRKHFSRIGLCQTSNFYQWFSFA